MKNFRSCPNQGKCKGFHLKHNKGAHKKHHGGDEKQLLFELFKQFLRMKLQEQQRERQQGECPETNRQCQETGEVEIVNCCGEENDFGQEVGPRKHCHKFGPFKGGKHHKRWGKHHHGHGHHQKKHGPYHHHGPHPHHGHGKHHMC